MNKEKLWGRGIPLLVLLSALVIISILAGLSLGSAQLSLGDILQGLLGKPELETEGFIISSIRWPRVFSGLFAGIGLSVAGVLLQAVTNNALASPNIIGVNAGAGFAVILCMCLFPMAFAWLPVAAFVGALITTLFIITLAHKINSSKITIVLAGIACTALLSAGISFLSMLYPDVFESYHYFSVGGFSGTPMEQLYLPAGIILVCFMLAMVFSRQINLLCLGDSMAASLGVRVKRLRMICLVLASASAASVVSYAGLLGFVGLVVPHIGRRLVGTDVRWLLPTSALLGASLVILSDMVGRVAFAPSEIPVGIIMALIGAPFFFVLLIKRRTQL